MRFVKPRTILCCLRKLCHATSLKIVNPVNRVIISTWRKRRICLKLCYHTNVKTIKKIQGKDHFNIETKVLQSQGAKLELKTLSNELF